MLKEKKLKVVIYTPCKKLEINLKKYYMKWDSKKCLLTISLKVVSGISIPYSFLKNIPLEIYKILFMLVTLHKEKLKKENIQKKLKMYMKKETMDLLDINTISKKKNHKDQFSEPIPPQPQLECYIILLRKLKMENLNLENSTLLIEYSEMSIQMLLIQLNSTKLKVLLLIKKLDWDI